MRSAEQWLWEEMGIEMPHGDISGSWFAEHNLPLIVECCCCQTTMALPTAVIDREGNIFCPSCAE